MDLAAWDEEYRKRAATTTESFPAPLLIDAVRNLTPGRALDLACGTGRNALWLAEHGWNVTAVDGSPLAIDMLRSRAAASGATIDLQVADLEEGGFNITPARYDLIVMCYYFERKLIASCKRGLAPGGVIVLIALLMEPGKELSTFRLQPGELAGYFAEDAILYYREATDAWGHRVAELIARRSPIESSV